MPSMDPVTQALSSKKRKTASTVSSRASTPLVPNSSVPGEAKAARKPRAKTNRPSSKARKHKKAAAAAAAKEEEVTGEVAVSGSTSGTAESDPEEMVVDPGKDDFDDLALEDGVVQQESTVDGGELFFMDDTPALVKAGDLGAPPPPLPASFLSTTTAAPEDDGAATSLFYVDSVAHPVKKSRTWVDPSAPVLAPTVEGEQQDATKDYAPNDLLVLPSHVVMEKASDVGPSADGVLTEAEVFAELGEMDIEFLDGNDDRPATRYFDAGAGEESFGAGGKANIVCSVCKQRGHMQRDCTMQICLTCGAVDEHNTRQCPVALVCFACGGRGHRSRECNAPRSQQRHRGHGPMCERCGSDVHPANNCPTLWRIYNYLSPSVRQETLTERQRLKALGGFEGDVLEADPDTEWGDGDGGWGGWCYNCSSEGHWGDDCPEPRTTRSNLQDFSAFSSYNAHNSPFFSASASTSRPTGASGSPSMSYSRRQRDRAKEYEAIPSQVADVGRRGKAKDRERARAYAAATNDDDEEDWFGKSSRGGNGNGRASASTREWDRDRERDRRGGGDRRDNRAGSGRDSPSFRSGGSGTELEREYREATGRGGGNHDGVTSIKGRSSQKPAGGGFSFKFGSQNRDRESPASALRPSLLSRIGADSPSSSSTSGGGGRGSYDRSSDFPRGSGGGGGGGGKKDSQGRYDRRDDSRKEKERRREEEDRRQGSGGGGRAWLDSPDRRETSGSGSRYRGGYR